ncbi:MmgE/PrpD [Xylariaceae sp. FL0016]|nr:MmgE/PrpD [Xylariaceae sp. FL0016]
MAGSSPIPQEQPLSELFAKHVLETQYSELSPDAIAQAKVFILDTLGVGISGSSAYGTSTILETLTRGDKTGASTLWGHACTASAPVAALLNAYQTHCQEYDCVHEGAVLHPLATILPAVLAYISASDAPPVSGADLILAVALGVNVSCGLGISSRSAMRFFRPATAGGFGAVASLGRLMGLTLDELVSAFGLQYTQTSGTLQPHVEGSAALPLQVGLNARAALLACELAKNGMSGPRGAFDGTYGFLTLVEGPEPADLRELREILRPKDKLSRRWLVSEISHKPYPAGRASHAGVEGLLIMISGGGKDGQGKSLSTDSIANVKITAPPLPTRLCSRPDVPNPSPNYARLCMSYIGAKVLQHSHLDLSHYRGSELTDPVTHELAKRIVMVSDEQEDPNALMPVSLELQMTDGTVRKWRCDEMLASPGRRLTREQHLAKFRRCWEFSIDGLGVENREKAIDMVDNLERLSNVNELLTCISASPKSKL